MQQNELVCFSNKSLDEMRMDIEKVIFDFPNRNNNYLKHILDVIVKEITSREHLIFDEVDEINDEDLQASAEFYDGLVKI